MTSGVLLPLCLAALVASASAASAWPIEAGVSRYLFDTGKGSLHYVARGNLTSEPPLVLLHSDPRSTTEFRAFVDAFSKPKPFIAVDYYGMGMSDDCRCTKDEFVDFREYAKELLKILRKHDVQKFVPFGNLKGTNSALALADLAGPEAVDHVVQVEPLVLSASATQYMNTKFIPSILDPPLNVTGDHLLKAWKDPSAAPFGKDPSQAPDDLALTEAKTLDFLRCRNANSGSGRSKNQKAWVAYNTEIVPAVERISKYAKFLFVYSPWVKARRAMYGLSPDWSMAQLSAALGNVSYMNRSVDAWEGMLETNASIVAAIVEEFLSPSHIVV